MDRAHISGLSLGAATGMWLAAKHPEPGEDRCRCTARGPRTDAYLRVVVEGWRIMAQGLGSVTDMVIKGIFPWCLTPELYAAQPDYVDSLADFVRSRPMPPVDAFLRQSEAVLAHDARAVLGAITAPTLITFGRHDVVTSTRFADAAHRGITGVRADRLRGLLARRRSTRTSRPSTDRTLAFLSRHPAGRMSSPRQPDHAGVAAACPRPPARGPTRCLPG